MNVLRKREQEWSIFCKMKEVKEKALVLRKTKEKFVKKIVKKFKRKFYVERKKKKKKR